MLRLTAAKRKKNENAHKYGTEFRANSSPSPPPPVGITLYAFTYFVRRANKNFMKIPIYLHVLRIDNSTIRIRSFDVQLLNITCLLYGIANNTYVRLTIS